MQRGRVSSAYPLLTTDSIRSELAADVLPDQQKVASTNEFRELLHGVLRTPKLYIYAHGNDIDVDLASAQELNIAYRKFRCSLD